MRGIGRQAGFFSQVRRLWSGKYDNAPARIEVRAVDGGHEIHGNPLSQVALPHTLHVKSRHHFIRNTGVVTSVTVPSNTKDARSFARRGSIITHSAIAEVAEPASANQTNSGSDLCLIGFTLESCDPRLCGARTPTGRIVPLCSGRDALDVRCRIDCGWISASDVLGNASFPDHPPA